MNRKIWFALIASALLLSVAPSLLASKLVLDGNEIELDPSQDVFINPVTGDIEISSAAGNLSCSEPTPNPPSIGTFSLSPSQVDPGGSVQLTWSTQGAASCQAAATTNRLPAWSGAQDLQRPAGSPLVLTAPTNSGTYTAALSCTNAAGTVQSTTRQVTVSSPTNPACNDRPPPSGMQRATSVLFNQSDNGQTWSSVFSSAFPGTPNTRYFFLASNRYAAIELNTGSLPSNASGNITFEASTFPPASPYPGGNKAATISTCPGDFNPGLGAGCSRFFATGAIHWRGVNGNGSGCVLQPNTTYYLNIVYTDQNPSQQPVTDWLCGASPTGNCANYMNHAFNGF